MVISSNWIQLYLAYFIKEGEKQEWTQENVFPL